VHLGIDTGKREAERSCGRCPVFFFCFSLNNAPTRGQAETPPDSFKIRVVSQSLKGEQSAHDAASPYFSADFASPSVSRFPPVSWGGVNRREKRGNSQAMYKLFPLSFSCRYPAACLEFCVILPVSQLAALSTCLSQLLWAKALQISESLRSMS
jgi:hypothetical protein